MFYAKCDNRRPFLYLNKYFNHKTNIFKTHKSGYRYFVYNFVYSSTYFLVEDML